jgi:hypothetical protein
MPTNADLRQDTRYPILSVAPRGPRGLWDAMVLAAVPSAAPEPAQIRAMAFAASLGPAAGPRTVAVGDDADDVVIDLAGEEAFLGYLARVAAPVN